MDTEDVLLNLWTDKYTFKEKISVLAELEKNRSLLISQIKKLQPDYIYFDGIGEEVATINLIEDLKVNTPNFKNERC